MDAYEKKNNTLSMTTIVSMLRFIRSFFQSKLLFSNDIKLPSLLLNFNHLDKTLIISLVLVTIFAFIVVLFIDITVLVSLE